MKQQKESLRLNLRLKLHDPEFLNNPIRSIQSKIVMIIHNVYRET